MNWLDFVRGVLAALGAPVTPENEAALLTVLRHEQPPESPNAAFNPFNIQAGNFPHVSTSGTGQYDFATFDDGVAQTAAFLRQSNYTGIVASLQAGDDASRTLQAWQDSPWAESHYGYALVGSLGETIANWARYAGGAISGAPGGGSTGSPPSGVATGQTTATALGGLDPFGIIGRLVGGAGLMQGVLRVVLVGLGVAGGVALITVGAWRAVSPIVKPVVDDATKAAGTAMGAAKFAAV